jgi:uncharacterized membrane protein
VWCGHPKSCQQKMHKEKREREREREKGEVLGMVPVLLSFRLLRGSMVPVFWPLIILFFLFFFFPHRPHCWASSVYHRERERERERTLGLTFWALWVVGYIGLTLGGGASVNDFLTFKVSLSFTIGTSSFYPAAA